MLHWIEIYFPVVFISFSGVWPCAWALCTWCTWFRYTVKYWPVCCYSLISVYSRHLPQWEQHILFQQGLLSKVPCWAKQVSWLGTSECSLCIRDCLFPSPNIYASVSSHRVVWSSVHSLFWTCSSLLNIHVSVAYRIKLILQACSDWLRAGAG